MSKAAMQIEMTADERLIGEALMDARHIQEFLWGELSLSVKKYDADEWRKVFQKRVNRIAEIDMNSPSGIVLLRKALLQQAALSIAALAVIDRK